jgi:3'-phosphoadenosine 5'-phosphosulfate sulfotransferase (PAPS reductase)/FAD synthetase
MKTLTKKIVSFSGGKDSTAMLLRLMEENYQVDDIVFFDTGWEFPDIIEHVQKVQDYIGREITVLHPKNDFIYTMIEKPLKSGRTGYGWPAPRRRWCTAEKRDGIKKYTKQFGGAEQYIGFAADEVKRTGCGNGCSGERVRGVTRLYPLIFDWDMDEAACLRYCYDRGFDWGGLYEHLSRVSCFCCPLQRIGGMRSIRKIRPELWAKMLKWDAALKDNRGFWGYHTVHDLDRRFAAEDLQMDLFPKAK